MKKQCKITPNFSTYDKHWASDKIKKKRTAGEFLIKDECDGCEDKCMLKCKAIYARSLIDCRINRGKFSYERDVLIIIEFYKCVPDMFHMYARNTDHFFDLLINDITTAGI